jgi:hypothetical protein
MSFVSPHPITIHFSVTPTHFFSPALHPLSLWPHARSGDQTHWTLVGAGDVSPFRFFWCFFCGATALQAERGDNPIFLVVKTVVGIAIIMRLR